MIGFSEVFAISSAGMAFEQLRVQTVAVNLANSSSTLGGFQPLEAVAVSFDSVLGELKGPVGTVVSKSVLPRRVYDPAHPHADAEGFVSFPDVNPVDEMSILLSASRAYEANVAAFNIAKAMAQSALRIGES